LKINIKMKTLIIYAHPETKGHNPLILKQVKAKLDAKNKDYEILDLYKMKYDPILHKEEHYTQGNTVISKQNKEIQEKIKQSDLIFIYPVWWGTMPAILKGFFDKVLTPGFAYIFKGKMPTPLLKGKKALVITTVGAPNFFYLLTGNRPKKIISKNILKFCGIKTKVFQIDNANKLNKEQEQKIKKAVNKGLQYLFS